MKNALSHKFFSPIWKTIHYRKKRYHVNELKLKGGALFWTCLSYNGIKTKQTAKKLMKEIKKGKQMAKIATAFLDSTYRCNTHSQISGRWRWQHNRQMEWVKSANFVLYFYGSCRGLLFREGKKKRTLIAKGNGLSRSSGVVKKTSVWPFFFFFFGNA